MALKSILIAPHADDESLFASFICQRFSPEIVVCYDEGRNETELAAAAGILGCEWSSLGFQKGQPKVSALSKAFSRHYGKVDQIFAPAFEREGHEEHNLVAHAALRAYGNRVQYYLTYAPRGERSRHGTEIIPETPWVGRKLRALACYESQLYHAWFFRLLDLREWMA
jgi:LmbE family N-acetylglucosaminyl deacetylase